MLGPEVGRKGGWPGWYDQTNGVKDVKKVHEASRYYDVANFASLIRCPVLIGVGLHDGVCPPAGIFAMANQISAPKEIVILPRAGHMDMEGGVDTHATFKERVEKVWLPDLVRGKPAPVSPAKPAK